MGVCGLNASAWGHVGEVSAWKYAGERCLYDRRCGVNLNFMGEKCQDGSM